MLTETQRKRIYVRCMQKCAGHIDGMSDDQILILLDFLTESCSAKQLLAEFCRIGPEDACQAIVVSAIMSLRTAAELRKIDTTSLSGLAKMA